MATAPTVSINLCCYNAENYLRQALDSVLAQTYKDWELVIINDGSSDATESIVRDYMSQAHARPIIYHYQENHGLGYARNQALKLSSGKYIAFIDHDDIWLPEKLEKQIQRLDKDPGIGLTFTNAVYFSEENKRNKFLLYKNCAPPSGRIFGDLLKHYFLCLSTVVVRREALGHIDDCFEEVFKVAEEVDVFLRLAYKWDCAYIDYPSVMFRMHASSSTSNMFNRFPAELEIIFAKLTALYPEIQERYVAELHSFTATIQYLYAISDLRQDKVAQARERLLPLLFSSKRIFLTYILSLLPLAVFKYISAQLRSYKI